MRSSEEMKKAVHERAVIIRRRLLRRITVLSVVGSAVLSAVLLVLIGSETGLSHRMRAAEFAGASLLGENVGGYVLAGVAAFMAGVIVTLIAQHKRNRE